MNFTLNAAFPLITNEIHILQTELRYVWICYKGRFGGGVTGGLFYPELKLAPWTKSDVSFVENEKDFDLHTKILEYYFLVSPNTFGKVRPWL